MESANEEPKYEAALRAVTSLTPESRKEDTDAAVAKLKETLVNIETSPAQKREVFARLDLKANSYESNKEMWGNKQAMYIAREIRGLVIWVRNAINSARFKGKKIDSSKYGL